MTPSEALLWERLRDHRLAGLHIRRQHVLYGFIADFYCHAARLVIEVDGDIHAGRHEADTERDAILIGHGLRIVRITNDEIHADLPGALERIVRLCHSV